MKVRVVYEPRHIRHIAIQCPKCKNWFYGDDITSDELTTEYNIDFASYVCPKCNHAWSCSGYPNHEMPEVEETSYPEVYRDCLQKNVIWE